MRRLLAVGVLTIAALITIQPATAQDQSVQKWDLYGGYSYLNTPTNSLGQQGFNLSFGRNINRWLALGLDFSHFAGSGTQAMPLPAPLTGSLNVPYDASTSTFAAGTQFQVRPNKWITPFFRPFLGAFHSSADAKVNEIVLPPGVPPALLQAIPASELKRSDTVLGYGAGGGFDFNISTPIGIRVATDYIRTGLFGEHQNNVRVAFGLIYRFGGAISK